MESISFMMSLVSLALIIILIVAVNFFMVVFILDKLETSSLSVDMNRLASNIEGMYIMGTTHKPITVYLTNRYDITVTENSIILKRTMDGRELSKSFPVFLVPKSITDTSSVNLSYKYSTISKREAIDIIKNE